MVVCLLKAFLECLVDLRTGLVVDSRRIALDFLVGSNQTVSKIDDDIYKRFDGWVQGVVVKMVCERSVREYDPVAPNSAGEKGERKVPVPHNAMAELFICFLNECVRIFAVDGGSQEDVLVDSEAEHEPENRFHVMQGIVESRMGHIALPRRARFPLSMDISSDLRFVAGLLAGFAFP